MVALGDALQLLGRSAAMDAARRRRWRCSSRCRPSPISSRRSPRWRPTKPSSGRSEDAIRYADRALALAEELGLPRPARALGYRGMARASLGDTGGLEDFREAIALATEAGQGREVALLHNNLELLLWRFEGPAACLEVQPRRDRLREGRGASPRCVDDAHGGIARRARRRRRARRGARDRRGASPRAWRRAGTCSISRDGRAAQTRVLDPAGPGRQAAEVLDWLERAADEIGDGGHRRHRPGLVAAGARRARSDEAASRACSSSSSRSPAPARSAKYFGVPPRDGAHRPRDLGEFALAERLVGGFEPRYPYAEHALVAANARSPRRAGTWRPRPMATPMPPIAGSGSGSSPSRRSRSSARAGVCSGSRRPTEAAPSCATPERSSSGSRRPRRSPRPTRSSPPRPDLRRKRRSSAVLRRRGSRADVARSCCLAIGPARRHICLMLWSARSLRDASPSAAMRLRLRA